MKKSKLRSGESTRRNGKSALNYTDDSGIDLADGSVSITPSSRTISAGQTNHLTPHAPSPGRVHDSCYSSGEEDRYLQCSPSPEYMRKLQQEDDEYFSNLEQHPCNQLSFCVFIISCVFVLCTFAFPQTFSQLKISEKSDKLFLNWDGTQRLAICAFLSSLGIASLLGFTCTCFTWCFTYLDSHTPGVIPPTPFSDDVSKSRSGHRFHLNYVMSVMNGVTLSCYALWRMREYYLVH